MQAGLHDGNQDRCLPAMLTACHCSNQMPMSMPMTRQSTHPLWLHRDATVDCVIQAEVSLIQKWADDRT